MTPYEISRRLTELTAEACSCHAAWSQHKGEATPMEVYRIRSKVEMFLRALYSETMDAAIRLEEQAHVAKELERMHIQNLGRDVQG